MCILVCKLHLDFPDSKHLRGFVCHEIFGNFFVIRKFLAYTPPPPPHPPPPTKHASYGPAGKQRATAMLCLLYTITIELLLLLSTFYWFLHRFRLASCYFPQHIDGRLRVQDLPQDPCCSKQSDLLKISCVTAYFQLVQVILYIVGHRSQGAYDDWQYKYLGHALPLSIPLVTHI